jgi:hypothetical protein
MHVGGRAGRPHAMVRGRSGVHRRARRAAPYPAAPSISRPYPPGARPDALLTQNPGVCAGGARERDGGARRNSARPAPAQPYAVVGGAAAGAGSGRRCGRGVARRRVSRRPELPRVRPRRGRLGLHHRVVSAPMRAYALAAGAGGPGRGAAGRRALHDARAVRCVHGAKETPPPPAPARPDPGPSHSGPRCSSTTRAATSPACERRRGPRRAPRAVGALGRALRPARPPRPSAPARQRSTPAVHTRSPSPPRPPPAAPLTSWPSTSWAGSPTPPSMFLFTSSSPAARAARARRPPPNAPPTRCAATRSRRTTSPLRSTRSRRRC